MAGAVVPWGAMGRGCEKYGCSQDGDDDAGQPKGVVGWEECGGGGGDVDEHTQAQGEVGREGKGRGKAGTDQDTPALLDGPQEHVQGGRGG